MMAKKRDRDKGRRTEGKAIPEPVIARPKVTVNEEGKAVKQYPANIGYHGTADEKELSPEE